MAANEPSYTYFSTRLIIKASQCLSTRFHLRAERTLNWHRKKEMQFTECLENEFAGKVALVLGGSSGIGLGAAELLARRGAKVIIIGHDDSVARATVQISSVHNRVAGFQGDASEEAFMRCTIEKVISDYGGIDILVNSAAIIRWAMLLKQMSRCGIAPSRSIYAPCI